MSTDARPRIELRENGPLVVKNLHSLKDADGAMLAPKPVTALCRCGHSKTKPFCDGSHKQAGFISTNQAEAAGRDRRIDYAGQEVTVSYNPRLCSHAAECGRIASHIFNPAQKPWVQPDKGNRHEVEAVIAACPSGALAFAGPGHLTLDRPQIMVEENGPYWVCEADIDAPAPGEGASGEKFVLCRCGMSGNKPYCDGTHRDKGWKSRG
jgi:CDGSH-type Zn-finger protein